MRHPACRGVVICTNLHTIKVALHKTHAVPLKKNTLRGIEESSMVFSTIAFLFQFLPIFLLAYYATPQKYRNITLVIGSLVFYAIGSGWYTLLLLLSLLINYGLSRMISGTHARHPESAKHYLIAGLIYNFGLLVVFKYTNFLIGNLNSLLSIFHTAIPKEIGRASCRERV